ncbi:MAG: hypothetical protein CO132_02880 [Candidatus Kerfeldbacteria bacterium CG_4_9_14_3_um_filter_45_8]|nr:MAG: hypothetical protein CO132_02880 [Candidatus Kerfeldbacteria bacterium CG_4_9_14_3_um_filter_45_8]
MRRVREPSPIREGRPRAVDLGLVEPEEPVSLTEKWFPKKVADALLNYIETAEGAAEMAKFGGDAGRVGLFEKIALVCPDRVFPDSLTQLVKDRSTVWVGSLFDAIESDKSFVASACGFLSRHLSIVTEFPERPAPPVPTIVDRLKALIAPSPPKTEDVEMLRLHLLANIREAAGTNNEWFLLLAGTAVRAFPDLLNQLQQTARGIGEEELLASARGGFGGIATLADRLSDFRIIFPDHKIDRFKDDVLKKIYDGCERSAERLKELEAQGLSRENLAEVVRLLYIQAPWAVIFGGHLEVDGNHRVRVGVVAPELLVQKLPDRSAI